MMHPDQDRTVLDPGWEEELRAGLEADGGQGSVERELEVLHVLRHARAPEPIDESRLDALWGEIEAQAYPSARGTSWWQRRWWVAVVPAATAAAVLLFVMRPDDGGDAMRDSSVARNEAREEGGLAGESESNARVAAAPASVAEPSKRASASSVYEAQFAALAPRSRAVVFGAVDDGRDKLRAELIAEARLADFTDVDVSPASSREVRDSRSGSTRSSAAREVDGADSTRPAEADADAASQTQPNEGGGR